MTEESAPLADHLTAIRARIAGAARRSGRDPDAVRILAVTKGQPAATIAAALSVGLTDIGESRVQEAQLKRNEVTDSRVRWHMVGHVQRNKARLAAELFDTVHSVDGPAIAASLAAHRPARATPIRVFIEVELTGIATRSGIAPAAAGDLLAAVRRLPALDVAGLMTIAPPGSEAAARECFGRLRSLRDQLRDATGLPLVELSMGMSDDFEVAVEEGATLLRLGRALFGERPEQPGH